MRNEDALLEFSGLRMLRIDELLDEKLVFLFKFSGRQDLDVADAFCLGKFLY